MDQSAVRSIPTPIAAPPTVRPQDVPVGGASYELRLQRKLLAGFAVAHGVFLLTGFSFWASPSPPLVTEWAIDADISDIGGGQEGLAGAEQKGELAVRKELLPQLPKVVSVKEPEPPPEGEVIATQPKPEVTADGEEKKEVEAAPETPKDNPIEDVEKKRRALMDELRKQKKEADKHQAPSEISRIAAAIDEKGIGTASWRQAALKMMRDNFRLPEVYGFSNTSIKATVTVLVSDRGELSSAKIVESSGDTVFDSLVLEAIRNTAGLPKPPPAYQGKQTFIFTPRDARGG